MNVTDWVFVVLYYVNLVMVGLVTISFIPQFIYYFFFFLKRRHWKDAKTNHYIAVVIPAHNEESVIRNTVENLLNNINYPKDHYRVFVCAHNCSDHTADEARKAGATVYVCNDSNPKHRTVGYPMKYSLTKILEEYPEVELFIKFDADNIAHPDYLKEMNKSFDAGAKIIRGYEAASNLKENIWTEECAIFYFKDSRVQNTFRQAVKGTAMATGPGLAFSKEIVERMDGWDCMTKCDDAEFGWNRLFDGYKVYFNSDAIVYEDQPSTFADSYNRLVRLGHSLNKLFWTDGWKMLVSFFKTGNPMYLDMLIQISYNPITFICFAWFPTYYIAYAVCMLMQLSGVHVFTLGYFQMVAPDYLNAYQGMSNFAQLSGAGYTAMIQLLIMAVRVIATMLLFCIFQSWISVFLDRRKLGMDWKLKGMWKGIIFSPFFTLIYGICNFIGVCSDPKWKIANRNPSATKIDYPLPERPKKTWYITISPRELRRYDGHWWKKKQQKS